MLCWACSSSVLCISDAWPISRLVVHAGRAIHYLRHFLEPGLPLLGFTLGWCCCDTSLALKPWGLRTWSASGTFPSVRPSWRYWLLWCATGLEEDDYRGPPLRGVVRLLSRRVTQKPLHYSPVLNYSSEIQPEPQLSRSQPKRILNERWNQKARKTSMKIRGCILRRNMQVSWASFSLLPKSSCTCNKQKKELSAVPLGNILPTSWNSNTPNI